MNRLTSFLVSVAMLAVSVAVVATENLPHLPFGQTVVVPAKGQFKVTPYYGYNYWKSYWKNHDSVSIERIKEDGFDHNTGMVLIEYGLTDQIAFDLSPGFTSAATRFYDVSRTQHTTMGMMDTQFGIRYQLTQEERDSWKPNITVRLGGIIQGTYEADYPFAPGDGSSGMEASVGFTKQLFDFGLGVYGQGGWRVRNNGVPQTLFGSVGVNQTLEIDWWKIQHLILSFGYLHLQDLGGPDVQGTLVDVRYTRDVKEVIRGIEGGVGVQFKNKWYLQYYMEYSMDGRNTPQKTMYGLYLTFPLGGY